VSNSAAAIFGHPKASSLDDQGAKKPRNPCAVFEDDRLLHGPGVSVRVLAATESIKPKPLPQERQHCLQFLLPKFVTLERT
jgi:hypothetical protein